MENTSVGLGLKILSYLFPFLKEIVLGNTQIREVMARNKLVTAFVTVNLLLFGLYMYAWTEARNKDYALIENLGKVSQLEERLSTAKERYEEKEKSYKDRIEALMREGDGDDARIKTLTEDNAKLRDRIAEVQKDNANLREQFRLKDRADNARTARQRSMYLEQLERLRRQESGS